MNKQQLASKIWESANKMRSKIEANEYKDYILGFIFYKFLSEREVKLLREQGATDEDIKQLSENDLETREYVRKNVGYFIAYEDLFSTWIEKGSDFTIDNVHTALSAFSRLISPNHKRVFDGIFTTLETGLSKLGENAAAQTKAVRDLVHLIKDIPMDGRQDYDVLGFIYEYLISMFAANAGKKAGEFYTPHEVSLLMSQIVAWYLRDRKQIEIYDPTSGSGSLLINIGRSMAQHVASQDGIKYYAQELKQNTYNLTRMNLVMRGINPDNIETRNGDTLESDWPLFDDADPAGTYRTVYVDAVVSNPPYSQNWDPSNKDTQPRFAYGLAPKSKADYAFLLHDLYHVKPDGVMTIVLPHGVLFRGGEEGTIRKNLIEHRNIEAIIGLPANIFFGTGIPTIVMVLRQRRDADDILIIDASRGYEKVGKNNRLRASDIKRIVDAVVERKDVAGFAHVASLEEVRSNDYNLNIPRYVDSSEPAEPWDIYALMYGGIPRAEVDAMGDCWGAWPGLRADLFKDDGSPYVTLAVADASAAIREHPEVLAFKKRYERAFDGFAGRLRTDLVDGALTVDANVQEQILAEDMFARLAGVELVDRYEAYQVLDNEWAQIAGDLEILQTEGLDALCQVDPNLVLKKKNGKDEEVQDGWRGHVLPFDLVQRALLGDESAELADIATRLGQAEAAVDEILESLSEEDKGSDVVNDEGDAFVAAAVARRAKEIAKELKRTKSALDAESFDATIVRVNDLFAEQKTLKTRLRTAAAQLQQKTKETIEGLTQEQTLDLLEAKWINPLMDELLRLPDNVIDNVAGKVKSLAQKYSVTFADVDSQIHEAEAELMSMLDNLTGSEFDMLGLNEFKSILAGE